jgi:glycosyltransferase involved in cell wall biosynthesis
MKVLVLCPQVPIGYNAGGSPARSFFVLQSLAADHRLFIALLVDPRAPALPDSLAAGAARVFRPAVSLPPATGETHSPSANVASVLWSAAYPWRGDQKALLRACEFNCVERPEAGAAGSMTERCLVRLSQRLYGWLLLGMVGFWTLMHRVRPARGCEVQTRFREVYPEILGAFQNCPPDVIWVESSFLVPEARQLMRAFPRSRLVINAHNVEHILIRRMSQLLRSPLARIWTRLQSWSMRREECFGLRQACWTLACSKEDALCLRELGANGPVTVVRNGVDLSYFSPQEGEESNPTIIFTGSCGYSPNRDAVLFFHREILPRVEDSLPNCRFDVVGFDADSVFSAQHPQRTSVRVHANVADVRPHLARAWVVVVPLRAGSGTRLKIVEAMAMGKPVVSTTLGAEGLEVNHGVDILLADTPNDFAGAVVRLLNDPGERKRIARNACSLVETRYAWSSVTKSAMADFHAALDRRPE